MILAFFSILAAASPLTFKLAPSGVTPGTYTNPIVTIDSRGRTTAAQNGRPLFYINALDYGAGGTGSSTDDTSELQAAIDATPEGGALYIPAGLYLVSSVLTVSKSITIFGDKYQSVIYNAPWFPTNQSTLKFSAGATKSGVTLTDFSIYPHPGYTGLETPGQHGILFDCAGSSGWTNIVISGMYVEAKNGAAVKIDNSDGDSTTASGIYIHNNALVGGAQLVNVGNGAVVSDNLIPYSSKGNSAATAGVQISLYTGATGGAITRNWITAHGGISVAGNSVVVANNYLLSSGATNTTTTNAVYIGASTNAEVRGNAIDPLLSASTWYGVNISASANSARIGPNMFNPAQWASYSANKILNNGVSSIIEADGDIIGATNNYFAYGYTNTFGGEVVFTNGVTLGGSRRTTWPTGGGGTNTSTVFVNNSTQVDGPSFNDSSEIARSVSGTNITDSLVANSIATNKINSTFYDWVIRPKGVYIDAGIATRLDDSGEILFNMSGATSGIAGIVDYSIDSLKLKTNNVTDLQILQYQAAIGRWTNATVSFSGGGTVSNVADTVDIDLTLAAGVISGVLPTTGISGGTYSNLLTVTYDAKGRASSAAGSLNAAALTNLNASELRSGIVSNTLLHSVLQRLAGIGAGTSGDVIYRDATGWTNLPKAADGTVLKLASGLPSWGTDNTGGAGGTTYTFTNGVTVTGTNVTANLLGAGSVTLSTNGSGVVTITGTTITNSPVSGLWQTIGSVDFVIVQYGTTNAAFTYTNYSGVISNISNIGDTGTDSRLQVRLDFNQNIGTNYFIAADFDGVDDLVSGQGTLFYSQETGRTNTYCEVSIVDNGGYQYADYGHKIRLRVVKTDAVAGGGDWPTNVTTLGVDNLILTSPIPASYITNATASRFAVFGADYRLTNDVAETGTGAPVRAIGPALTGDPTINGTNVMASVDAKASLASPAFTGTPTVNSTNIMAAVNDKQPLDADLTQLATLNGIALTNLSTTNLVGTLPTNRLDANTVQLAVAGSTGTGAFIRTSEYDRLSTTKTYESVFLDFVGGDSTKALYPGLFTAISSGVSATAASDGGVYRPHYMKGLFYITTASGVALNTGGTLSLFVQNQYLHTNESHFEMNGAIVATNSTVAFLGYGDFLSATTQDVDALKFAITNDVIVGSAINNSSETLTATTFNYVPNFYYRWNIDATNNAAKFTLSSNGVVVWTDSLASGIPRLSRQTTPLVRVWNGATAHTNSSTLMIMDNIGYSWSKAQ